jgi:two-component system, cell cycle sensor histidine kinase and response regulator CckA
MSERRLIVEPPEVQEWKYRLLAEDIRDVVWTTDLKGDLTYVSPSVRAQTGFTPEEYYSMSVGQRMPPESAARAIAEIQKQVSLPIEKRAESLVMEFQVMTKASQVLDVEINTSWMHDEDGTPIGIIGITRDITPRKRAEQALKESEERFRALVSFASEGIMIHGDGAIIDANQAFADFVGFPNPESLIGKNGLEVIPFTPASRQALVDHINKDSEETHDVEIVRPDGTLAHMATHGRGTILRGRPVRIVSMLDITDRKLAEEEKARLHEQLAQASKMEAIGRLAGGVAHDFNNLLTTILGYSELIQSRLAEDNSARTEIEEIQKAGERAASLTQQLLAFSRKQVINPRIIDMNAVVMETQKMLQRLIGENIKLVLNLAPDLGYVKIDPHQIEQVLMNLAVNARDAMPDGGTLTIATANLTFDRQYDHSYREEVASGPFVALSVADTGIGMEPETKARLFEPFFSTKENRRGTGLGLAMVYGIAKQNGGAISVHSEPGSGTLFQLCFPRVHEALDSHPDMIKSASPTGSETVLLVEDNDMVRRLARQVLSHLGYEVLDTNSPNGAIRICAEHPKPIHLLLSDVIMPEMNGVELYARLQAIRTELKVLFMSGYAEDVIARQGMLVEGMEFIQKPFTIETLATRVRQVLDN